jgi:hypothetical protein
MMIFDRSFDPALHLGRRNITESFQSAIPGAVYANLEIDSGRASRRTWSARRHNSA